MKPVCSRCNRNIVTGGLRLRIPGQTFQLCDSCQRDLIVWLKGKEKGGIDSPCKTMEV